MDHITWNALKQFFGMMEAWNSIAFYKVHERKGSEYPKDIAVTQERLGIFRCCLKRSLKGLSQDIPNQHTNRVGHFRLVNLEKDLIYVHSVSLWISPHLWILSPRINTVKNLQSWGTWFEKLFSLIKETLNIFYPNSIHFLYNYTREVKRIRRLQHRNNVYVLI